MLQPGRFRNFFYTMMLLALSGFSSRAQYSPVNIDSIKDEVKTLQETREKIMVKSSLLEQSVSQQKNQLDFMGDKRNKLDSQIQVLATNLGLMKSSAKKHTAEINKLLSRKSETGLELNSLDSAIRVIRNKNNVSLRLLETSRHISGELAQRIAELEKQLSR